MLFIGGRRSVLGAVLGAVGIQYLHREPNRVSVHILLIEGVLITVVLLIEPDGIAGIVSRCGAVPRHGAVRRAGRHRSGARAAFGARRR